MSPAKKQQTTNKETEEKIEVEKDIITELPEEEEDLKKEKKPDITDWQPKTTTGKRVKQGEIKHISQILDQGTPIMETGIIDALLPNLKNELLFIGQSKGKFGGGQKRIFRQTQKKTPEGNKPSFSCQAVVGNEDGYVGVGYGKSKDTVPAREKALHKAKLNILKIKRGCGSWECGCKTPHSIPYKVIGKCGSTKIVLMPAPKGKGLCVEQECAKILKLAGIKDIWSKSFGQTRVKTNLVAACVEALHKLSTTKIRPEDAETTGIKEGQLA
ncbi:30S ribosomal protein S5 [Candidatus Woesearchaeota archaeon]|nr:30S ribosomal protein S5 [Candidatus Woesearchaeota archaeon]